METAPPEDDIPGIGEDRLDGSDLCISCLAELTSGCNSCPVCAAPISPTTGLSPFERVLAEGFIYRRAIAEPRNLLIVIGACAVFSLQIQLGVWYLYYHFFEVELLLFELAFAYLSILIGISAIWQCLKNYRRRPQ